MERPLDAGAVVLTERADVGDDRLDVGLGDVALEQDLLAAATEARLRAAAEVHHDLDHVAVGGQGAHALGDLQGQRVEQRVDVVGGLAPVVIRHSGPPCGGGRGGWSTDGCRHEGRFGDAHERLLEQQRYPRDRAEPGVLQAAVERRFVGPDGRQDALVGRTVAAATDHSPLRSPIMASPWSMRSVGSCSGRHSTRR